MKEEKKKKTGDDDEAKELRPREWNPVLFAFGRRVRPFHAILLVQQAARDAKTTSGIPHRSPIFSHLQSHPCHRVDCGSAPRQWNTIFPTTKISTSRISQWRDFSEVGKHTVYASLYHFSAGAGSTFHAIFILFTPFLFTRQSHISSVCICFLFQFSTLH